MVQLDNDTTGGHLTRQLAFQSATVPTIGPTSPTRTGQIAAKKSPTTATNMQTSHASCNFVIINVSHFDSLLFETDVEAVVFVGA